MEDEGKVNLSVRMKKKALQGALEAAAKKKKARAGSRPRPSTLADCSDVCCTCVPVPGALQLRASTVRNVKHRLGRVTQYPTRRQV